MCVKISFLALFTNSLAFHIEDHTFILKRQCHGLGTVGENMNIDVRTLANVSGEHATNQPWSEAF